MKKFITFFLLSGLILLSFFGCNTNQNIPESLENYASSGALTLFPLYFKGFDAFETKTICCEKNFKKSQDIVKKYLTDHMWVWYNNSRNASRGDTVPKKRGRCTIK